MSAPELSKEAVQAWEKIATYWDEQVGPGGNNYWKALQEPCLGRLFAGHLKPGCRALDLATGNGLCARWMASRGASVLATDGTCQMLEVAKGHAQTTDKVSFQKLDVTDPNDFEALDKGEGFDAILMNMAMMDVATLDPLAAALPKLLKKDGVFVVTLLHPVFFTSGAAKNIEVKFDPNTGDLEVIRTKILKEYLFVPPAKGVFQVGQPERQIIFHRPIHELFSTFFKTGLVMDALEEPAFTEADQVKGRVEASSNYTQLPAILAFRLRRAN